MLRIVCIVALLVGTAYGQLVPQILPVNCTAEEQAALSTCAMALQNHTTWNEIFQLVGQGIMSENSTETESMVMLDTVCSLLTDAATCPSTLKDVKDRCFITPFNALYFDIVDGLLELCAVPHREKHFIQIVKCNKKLDILNTVIADPEIINIFYEIINMTTAMGPGITAIMAESLQVFVDYQCRIMHRVGQLTPLSKVNATCGQETHDIYAQLYPKLLEMYTCDGHIGIDANTTRIPVVANSTATFDINTPAPGLPTNTVFGDNATVIGIGNGTQNNNGNNTGSYVQPGSGSMVYSLCAVLLAIVTVHMRN